MGINQYAKLWAAGAGLLCLNGCASSAPRAYIPISEPPSAARTLAFQRAYDTCLAGETSEPGKARQKQEAKSGRSGILLGTASGAAVGTVAAGGLATTVTGVTGSFVAGGAAVVLAPLAVGYGAYRGMTLLQRNAKEKAMKTRIENCMTAKQYSISSWHLLGNGDTSALSTRAQAPNGPALP